MNFCNDIDPNACAWIEQLIQDGQLTDGVVACKSITDITPKELHDHTQAHFFAGIGGWDAALRLAGWPAGRPVWTASLPCQPFSHAGKGKGFKDERGQLWIPFKRLATECRPVTIFGEQVAAAIGKGWLDRVFTDLEAIGYTCGAVVLGAHSLAAPHRRQRIYWVAYTQDADRRTEQQAAGAGLGRSGPSGGGSVGDTQGGGLRVERGEAQSGSGRHADSHGVVGNSGLVRCDEGERGDGCGQAGARSKSRPVSDRPSQSDIVAHGEQSGLEGHAGHGDRGSEPGREQAQADGSTATGGGMGNPGSERQEVSRDSQHHRSQAQERQADFAGGTGGNFWGDYRIIGFKDGSKRRIEPGVEPMVARLPKGVVRCSDPGVPIDAANTAEARRMRLHGYGNSIVPQVAAEFIKAVMEELGI